ncbi:shikimate kinase [Helicobacter didelphidarum]|uniref:Shikimate kinase n=1 Tax=Helicobacter didelphidarum TaxID=2040648 RepID=A0A3D8IMH8_9HELI|nr:shikimate kinase [Helicobacter didelphidarum]RDU66402.1 shikimate kinase [Helicobacter didelphidarum]
MRNIVLIGFMGSGKSSTAKQLANRLNYTWLDSDTYIQEQYGQTISDIFVSKGESFFRTLEADFIKYFSQKQNHIIATGGGMPIFNDTKKLGIRFYLQSDFNVIMERIQNQIKQERQNIRPLFNDIKQAYNLYMQRQKLYELQSDEIINANGLQETITQEILDILSTQYKIVPQDSQLENKSLQQIKHYKKASYITDKD